MGKKLDHRLDQYSPAVLSIFRVVYGLLFTGFGTRILFDWPVRFAHHVGVCLLYTSTGGPSTPPMIS